MVSRSSVAVSCSVLFALIACSVVASAQGAVLDFDSTPQGTSLSLPYVEDGFRITVQNQGGHYDIWGPETSICGSPTFDPCSGNFLNIDTVFGANTLRLTRLDGGAFDLLSMHILHSVASDVFADPPTFPCGIYCGVRSSNGGLEPFQSQTVMTLSGEDWTNVAWVEFYTLVPNVLGFSSAGGAIDDINVAPVPIPAAAWLLASALGVLTCARGSRCRASRLSNALFTLLGRWSVRQRHLATARSP